MDATVIVYSLKNRKGLDKTHLIRKVFGYKDYSNRKQYTYDRDGLLSKYIIQKCGKSVIIIHRKKERIVAKILNEHKIKYKKIRIKLEEDQLGKKKFTKGMI